MDCSRIRKAGSQKGKKVKFVSLKALIMLKARAKYTPVSIVVMVVVVVVVVVYEPTK